MIANTKPFIKIYIMEKKVFTIIIFFFFLTKVSAQIEVHSSNQVGIGTDNPQYKLHVIGDAFVTGDVIGNFYLRSDSDFLGTTGNYPITFKVNNTLSGSTGNSNNTNVSFGYEALLNPGLNNLFNTAMGYSALRNYVDGNGHNTAIGAYTLHSNTTGSFNTAIGSEALRSNLGGSYNFANGHNALYSNTIGSYNMAIGSETLRSNSEGSDNIANGHNALYSNTTGNGNIAIGSGVLYDNTTGSNNTAIGNNAGFGFRSANAMNNSTAIGYQAPITASNQVRIGNSAVSSIGGYVSWSNLSDARMAKNIHNDVPGLNFINNLQPVTYNMDLNAIDELTLGGKISFSQLQIGETLGGKKIIFDTSKDLGKNSPIHYGNTYYDIFIGENGWSLEFSVKLFHKSDVPIGNTYQFLIKLEGPSSIDTIYLSNYHYAMPVDDIYEWEWYKSEIIVPLDFGIITNRYDVGYPVFNPGKWNYYDDCWVVPAGYPSLNNTQQQARADKEAQVQTGFMAQDVKTAAQSVGYDFSGVDMDEAGLYSLRYSEFVVPLVKAVQELSEQNELLLEQINELKNRIEILENK